MNEICERFEIELTEEEARRIEEYTRRKCQINGKGEDYFLILLENEVLDYAVRRCINGA